MKMLLFILTILTLGLNSIQNSDIFCSKNVNLKYSEIIEHNDNLQIQTFTSDSIKKFFSSAKDKYKTNFTEDTLYSPELKNKVNDLTIQTNIYHYYYIFVCLQLLLSVLICIITIKLLKNKKNDDISKKEFLLISFLAIYQPIHILVTNINEIILSYGISVCIGTYLFFIVLYSLFKTVIKNRLYSAIPAIVVTSVTLNYYDFIHYAENTPIYLFIFVFILLYLSSLNSNITKNMLKGFSLALVVMVLFNFCSNTISHAIKVNTKLNNDIKELSILNSSKNKNRDIYIIILDMYGGQNILKNKFNFDNNEFLETLKSEGFYVFDHMYSNYNKTCLSLPSFLNLNYVDNTGYKDSSNAINNALLFKIANYNNYKIYYLNSWDFHIKDEIIDKVYNTQISVLIDTMHIFFSSSLLRKIIPTVLHKLVREHNYIDKILNDKYHKKFVFLHILAPHYPYLYDENGNINDILLQEDLNKSYLGYLKYTNKETAKLIKKIKANSKNEPVIIVAGDHGFREEEWSESHFSILTAYYTPEHEYSHIKNSKTLLNFFINFSNYEFGTQIELQNDKTLYYDMVKNLPIDYSSMNNLHDIYPELQH